MENLGDNAKKWMVTFFYEQELRSYYMNGVLNGILSPGIHNTNLSLYTVDNYQADPTAQKSGIYLHIKKGSTFIFSNGYKINNSGVLEKDLNTLGNYLIKCTALEDISYGLYTWTKDDPISDNAKAFLGINREPIYYIIARLDYNPDHPTSFLAPTFNIVKNNKNYQEEVANPEIGDSFYFKAPCIGKGKDEISKEHSSVGINLPDGTKDYFGETIKNIYRSWLMVGSIVENPKVYFISSESPSDRYSYIGSSAAAANWNTEADIKWVQNHVFTSRGLIEYRKSLGNELDGKKPDFYMDSTLSNLYMDLGTAYDDNITFQQSNDWKVINNLGRNSETTTALSDYSFKINTEEFSSMCESVINSDSYEEKTSTNQNYKLYKDFLVTDILFMNLSKKIVINSNIDFVNYLTSSSNNALQGSSRLPVKGFRWASLPGSYNFDPGFDSEDQKIKGEYTHNEYSYDTTLLKDKLIVPQDVCAANLNRIKTIISNKIILPLIVDLLRKKNLLNVKDGNSLIPICMAFRKFRVSYNKGTSVSNYEVHSIDGFSSEETVHPSNILSFFDLQNNSTKINSINFKNDDVYSIIPVID